MSDSLRAQVVARRREYLDQFRYAEFAPEWPERDLGNSGALVEQEDRNPRAHESGPLPSLQELEAQRRRTMKIPVMPALTADANGSDEEEMVAKYQYVPWRFLTGPVIYDAYYRQFSNIAVSFDAFQYNIDHRELVAILIAKMQKEGVRGRLVLDQSNFNSPSSVEQPARVKELHDAGCQLRTVKPGGEGLSKMHAKGFILDGNVVLDGSVNLTWYGFQSNHEHAYYIAEPLIVGRVRKSFEELWGRATKVTPEMVAKAVELRATKVEE